MFPNLSTIAMLDTPHSPPHSPHPQYPLISHNNQVHDIEPTADGMINEMLSQNRIDLVMGESETSDIDEES